MSLTPLTINSATKLDTAKKHYNLYFKQQLTPKLIPNYDKLITAGIEQAIKSSKSPQNADGYTLELVITLKPVKVVATK